MLRQGNIGLGRICFRKTETNVNNRALQHADRHRSDNQDGQVLDNETGGGLSRSGDR